MPKIRGFKFDLWTNEDFVELSPYARLLWMGMWNYACDNGHLADKSKQIKMRVLPTDDVNCAELLRELEKNGQIVRSEGTITIPNFRRHQKPDKRWFQTCDLPDCERPGNDPEPETRGGRASPPRASGRPHGDVELSGVDVDGELTGAKKPARQLPVDWSPTSEHRKRCSKDGIDIDAQVARFRAHADANDRRQANWNASFTQWLLNVPQWQRGGSVAPTVITDPTQLPPVEESWMRRRK